MVQAVVFLIILSLALSINSSFSEIHQKAGKMLMFMAVTMLMGMVM